MLGTHVWRLGGGVGVTRFAMRGTCPVDISEWSAVNKSVMKNLIDLIAGSGGYNR